MMQNTTVVPIYEDILEMLLDIVSQNKTGDIPQHVLVCGATGTGKTVFLNRLAKRLSDAGRVIKLISFPYTMVRDASYITSMFLENKGQPVVLMVDDFDQLLDALDYDAQYQLRAFLFRNSAPMLIGTCSRVPSAVTDYRAAFYDAFRLFFLRPENIVQRFLTVADQQQLSNEKDWDAVQKMLAENLYYISRFSQIYPHVRSVQKTVNMLLDENHRYFRALFLSLPVIQQQIILAIASLHKPATLSEVRQLGNVNTSGITSALQRLAERSVIKRLGQQRRSYSYVLTDALFAEWLRRNMPQLQ